MSRFWNGQQCQFFSVLKHYHKIQKILKSNNALKAWMNNENGCKSKLLVNVMNNEILRNKLPKMITGSLKETFALILDQ